MNPTLYEHPDPDDVLYDPEDDNVDREFHTFHVIESLFDDAKED